MFDQHYWAETIAWRNLGVQLRPIKLLTAKELTASLRMAGGKEVMAHIEKMHAELVKEDGVRNALGEIEKLLSSFKSGCHTNSSK